MLLVVASSLVLLPGPGRAQLIPGLPVAVEARPFVSVPVGEVAESGPGLGAEVGYGVLVLTRLQVTSRFAVHGGYHYGRFGCGECGAVGLEGELPEEGFEAGVAASLPLPLPRVEPWVRAGALMGRKLQVSAPEGELVSDPGLGWTAGLGASVPLGSSFRLDPGIHYRTYPAEYAIEDLGFAFGDESGSFLREVQVSSVSLDVGLSYAF